MNPPCAAVSLSRSFQEPRGKICRPRSPRVTVTNLTQQNRYRDILSRTRGPQIQLLGNSKRMLRLRLAGRRFIFPGAPFAALGKYLPQLTARPKSCKKYRFCWAATVGAWIDRSNSTIFGPIQVVRSLRRQTPWRGPVWRLVRAHAADQPLRVHRTHRPPTRDENGAGTTVSGGLSFFFAFGRGSADPLDFEVMR